MVTHWHKLPREVVGALTLEIPKLRLGMFRVPDGAPCVPVHCTAVVVDNL